MRIYIADCDRNTQTKLRKIITDHGIGEVAGMSDNWEEILRKLGEYGPDVVMIGLVPQGQKAIAYIRAVRSMLPCASIVMLSQENDMRLIEKAYGEGAEFVIRKPVSVAEVERVLKNLELIRVMRWVLQRTGEGLSGNSGLRGSWPGYAGGGKEPEPYMKYLKGALQSIGILNESGSQDIITILRYMMEQNLKFGEITLKELCGRLDRNPKNLEQRIRRAALLGLENLADKGLDDPSDPIFNEYAAKLYQLDQIKREMSYIRGVSDAHGTVRIRNFLNGLLEGCRTC